MRLFIFELKKLVFSRRSLFTLALLAALIIGLFFRNMVFQELVIEEQDKRVVEYTQETQKILRGLVAQVNKDPGDSITAEQMKYLGSALNPLYEWKPLIKSEDWQARLRAENEFFLLLQAYKEAGGDFSLNLKEIRRTIAWNDNLLMQGIQPEPENYSIALPNFMKQVTDFFVNFGAILILLLLVGDILTSEFEQRSIQFLYTQPLKKTAILHSKWFSAVVVYLVVTLFLYLTAWLVGLLFGKTGTSLYPVMLETKGSFDFITIGQYIQWSLIGTTITSLFVISVCFIISLITKHSMVTLLATMALLVGGFFAMQVVPWDAQSWFDPFQFVFAGFTVQKVGALWYQSVPIVLLLAAILYMFSLLKINNTRVNN